jgi:hypothetical protein
MYMQSDQSPGSSTGTSSGRASFALPSSAASENFSHGSGFAWAGIQMTPSDRRAASINGGSTHPYSRAHSSPSSAPATSTMTLALPQV